MVFNSLSYLIFFPLVVLTFFLLPHKFRWLQLLIASCCFYMAFIPIYILVLAGTILIDYLAGIWIENSTGSRRKAILILSIVSNVGILAVFKYYNFFISSLNGLFHDLPLLTIILPIGLSFHTFQAMSYTIEVYRGNQKAERHFGIYALYVMFFPQLVAGPIERPQNMLHQFHEKKTFDYANITSGLRLILWGLFKKVVVADRLAIATDKVFNNLHDQTSMTLIVGLIFFSFQIYCDFSGYSDIALGSARILGFRLMKNFDAPYQSRSVAEFWRRWHISLSTWFRDYLYISLGGNRVSIPRWYFNLLFVFLISGLWHGANWTFIIWGVLHGIYLCIGITIGRLRGKFSKHIPLKIPRRPYDILQLLSTFTLVTITWAFFRANTLDDAFFIIRKIASLDSLSLNKIDPYKLSNTWLGLTFIQFSLLGLLIIFLAVADYLITGNHMRRLFSIAYVRYLIYFILLFCIIFLGAYKNNRYIYFQF